MIAHLLARMLVTGALFAAGVQPTAETQAAPATFRVTHGTAAVEVCTDYWCRPVGFFNEGVTGRMWLAAEVDGRWYAYLEANGLQGWTACDIPGEGEQANYQIVSELTGVVVADCMANSAR